MIQVTKDEDRIPLQVTIKGNRFTLSVLKKRYVVETVTGVNRVSHCIWYPTPDDHDYATAIFSTCQFPSGQGFIQVDGMGDYLDIGFATFPNYQEALDALHVLCAEINKITRG